MWRKFHFFCGTAVSCICITQTTAISCYGFHFIYMHAWCVLCNRGRHNATWLCKRVILAFISLWKLKVSCIFVECNMFYYAYHFRRKCCVLHSYLTIAVGNGRHFTENVKPLGAQCGTDKEQENSSGFQGIQRGMFIKL